MIQVEGLNFSYKRSKPLFDGLSFKAEAGSIGGIFGMNGAGKTSLFKIMAGALFPQNGKSEILGYSSKDRQPAMLSEIFMITEEFDFPSVKGLDFVKLHAPFYPRFDRAFFDHCISEFDVDINSNLQKLSYGQKKKALIAFGLAANTSVLLMDEPTNGLDIPSKSQFRKIMAAADTEERCILISTHQVRDLAATIDRIIILDKGQIIFNQSTSQIMDKLSFEKLKEDEENDRILYSEASLGSRLAICKKGSKDTQMDPELLFNAVVQSPEIINQAFN
jgi:ABC-2 type transport system ATP-binding protein